MMGLVCWRYLESLVSYFRLSILWVINLGRVSRYFYRLLFCFGWFGIGVIVRVFVDWFCFFLVVGVWCLRLRWLEDDFLVVVFWFGLSDVVGGFFLVFIVWRKFCIRKFRWYWMVGVCRLCFGGSRFLYFSFGVI